MESGSTSGERPPRMGSRWSSGSPTSQQQHRFASNRGGSEGFSGGGGGGRHHPYRHPQDFPPPGDEPGLRGGFGNQMPMGGGRRGGGGFMGRGRSPDYNDGSTFAKLFVGSVPRTATEEEIRPLFEEHGEVIEVALIKDKRTGQQQGCCFIKYATSEEADRAIRALHNQYTLPGGIGPVQVRYADGERERLGAVEHKLFVGSLNKQATEKEVEEIFSQFGRVEDVYIMRDDLKQSRGCGFVKFSTREMAVAAMNSLNGSYVMRGCDQPLIVRFADPKRPRPGDSRGGPTFGGPGFGRGPQAPLGVRPPTSFNEPMDGRMPPNAWHSMNPNATGLSSQASADGSGSNLVGRGGVATPSAAPDALGGPGGSTNGPLSNLTAKISSAQQGFNPSFPQVHPTGQQISSAQKPLMSPQNLPPSLQQQHIQQSMVSQSQAQPFQANFSQLGPHQVPQSIGLPSSQSLPSQQLMGLAPSLIQQNASSTALQAPLSLQQQGMSGVSNQQLPPSSISQLLQQPIQQLPSQLSQALLQQQAQALQSSFQSSQQAISQLQQQLQLMQQSNHSQQQSSETAKLQPQWSGIAPQSASSAPASAPALVMPSAGSSTPSLPATTHSAVPLTCNWTEHASPEGYKYYYNSVTRESKWEKPDELMMFEQQQQQQKMLMQQQQQQLLQHQQKLAAQQLQSSSEGPAHVQIPSSQQVSQMQQARSQMQLNQQAQLQLLQPSLSYQASSIAAHQNKLQELNYAHVQAPPAMDQTRVQQGIQAAQEWMWKNKPPGS